MLRTRHARTRVITFRGDQDRNGKKLCSALPSDCVNVSCEASAEPGAPPSTTRPATPESRQCKSANLGD